MASQSGEISDEENGNNSDIDPIEVAIDAGATLTRKYVSITEVILSLKSILITP